MLLFLRRVQLGRDRLALLHVQPGLSPELLPVTADGTPGWLSDWLSPEDSVYDVPVTVCVTHKRFIPCRRDNSDCTWSSDLPDIAMVRCYQLGEEL